MGVQKMRKFWISPTLLSREYGIYSNLEVIEQQLKGFASKDLDQHIIKSLLENIEHKRTINNLLVYLFIPSIGNKLKKRPGYC